MAQRKSPLKKILFVPDVHRPYHDKRAWSLFLKAAKDFGPDIIAIIGDFADFYAVSAHSKDPVRALQLETELASVEEGLDELEALGAKRKLYISGNHESRLLRYIQDRAQELHGVMDVPGLLNLKRRGWEWIPYKSHVSIGKLHLTHDVGASGRYSVFRCLDTFEASVVTGHSHRFAYIVEGNALGNAKVSAQFGHLLDVKQVDYMHTFKAHKDWGLGFGLGYLDPHSGYAYLTPVPIVNYTCVVNGKLYRN